jgi:hypothetical protein
LRATDLKKAAARMVLKDVVVENKELVVKGLYASLKIECL